VLYIILFKVHVCMHVYVGLSKFFLIFCFISVSARNYTTIFHSVYYRLTDVDNPKQKKQSGRLGTTVHAFIDVRFPVPFHCPLPSFLILSIHLSLTRYIQLGLLIEACQLALLDLGFQR